MHLWDFFIRFINEDLFEGELNTRVDIVTEEHLSKGSCP